MTDQDRLNGVLVSALLATSADIVHPQTHLALNMFTPANFAQLVVERARRAYAEAAE